MKLFWKSFLVYTLIASSWMPYVSYAETALYSPQNIFGSNSLDRNMMYLQANPTSPRVVNEYRLLGLSSFPDISNSQFRAALSSPSIVLSEGSLSNNADYRRLMETPQGRQELIRQYKQAFSSLSVTLDENLSQTRSALKTELTRTAVSEYKGPSQTEADRRLMQERITLKVNEQLLDSFSSDEKSQARERVEQAKRTLSNPRSRALFNFNNGVTAGKDPGRLASLNPRNQIANLRGYYTRRVTDPFGRDVNVYLPKNGEAFAGLRNLNAPDIVKQLKSGAIEVGMFGAILYGFLITSTAYQTVADFESNPMAFENGYDMAPLVAASSLGFLFGGWGTSLAVDGAKGAFGIRTQAIKNTNFLLNEGRLAISNPALRSQLIRANMSAFKSSLIQRATTYSGMAGGMIFSQIAMRYADKMRSCSRILKFDYGTFPEYKRNQIEASCQKNFLQIMGEVTSDPKVWKDVVAIMLSKKAMLLFGSSGAQAAMYGFSNKVGSQAALNLLKAMPARQPHSLKVVIRFAGRVGRVITSPTVIGFVAFMIVFEVISTIFDFAIDRVTYNMPANIAAEQMRELMENYKSKGWDATKVCDDRTLREGSILGNLKALWNWDREEECSSKLITAFISHHNNVNKKWRTKLLQPVSESINQWTQYTFDAVNLYRSTYMFYKDVIDQVRVEKQMAGPLDFNRYKTEESRSGLFKLQAHKQIDRYNHPLPLFRSEIFFGARYKNEDDPAISYPLINGASVDWEARYNDQEKIEFLNQRMNSFRTVVLPQLISDLENTPEDLPEQKKAEALEITSLLKEGSLLSMAEGLQVLSEASESEADRCAQSVPTGMREEHTVNGHCYFNFRHKGFLDSDFWQKDDMSANENALKFLKSDNVFYAGYQTQNNKRPFGIKPVGMGQRFLIKYYEKFKNNGVDHLLFESGYRSLTDYLAKQLVCGVDVTNGDQMLSNPIRYKLGLAPKFKAPKLPFKSSDFNPCDRSSYRNSNGVRWSHGWEGSHGFYHYIEDSENPEAKTRRSLGEIFTGTDLPAKKKYAGFVELVYKELPDHILNDFDAWWKTNVEPQFAEVLNKIYNDYYKDELIDQQLAEVVMIQNNNTNCYDECVDFEHSNKSGVAASIKQEFDTYFNYFLEPLLEGVQIDTRYVDLDEDAARLKLKQDFNLIKRDIYSVLDFLSGRTNALAGSELNQIYTDLLTSLSAEKLLLDPSASQNYEILSAKALKAIVNEKLYELQILFKTDGGVGILALYESFTAIVSANPELTESEREAALDRFKEEHAQNSRDFDSAENRAGKVLVEYVDWPEDQNKLSPTLEAVYIAQISILKGFDELIEIEELKASLKPVSQY